MDDCLVSSGWIAFYSSANNKMDLLHNKKEIVMAQYIDKFALVAEIERKRNDYINSFMTEQVHVLNDVLDFLDTLETKQVNLDAELEHYKADQNIKYEEDINMFEFAKHFFELGMQVSNKTLKGE